MIQPKPEFLERMKLLLGSEIEKYKSFLHKAPKRTIRINTLKTNRQELLKKLKEKSWNIKETSYENALTVENLLPGELGRAIEHQIGYYYVQDISSMMPPIALAPQQGEVILDLCSAPGSKTTQIAMLMQNKGTIIANDLKLDRLSALQANIDRCGVTNTIVTRMNGIIFCNKFFRNKIAFDKILVDASCSGEGIFRSEPKTMESWNVNMIKKFSNQQKKLCAAAISCLKSNGILVYSTCTHAPEENELVIDYLLKNFNVKLEQVNLPLKTRPGISEWQGKALDPELKKCRRIYPQDNDSEGFFVAKLRKL